jgi:hypothetical protein
VTFEVNEERGEVLILLDGKPYPMRPSYAAMKAIERVTGSTLTSLVFRLALPKVGLSLEEMSVIVTEGIRAAGADRGDKMLQAFAYDRVGELIYAGGFLVATDPIEQFLKNAITGGAQPKKKDEGKADPATPTGTTTAD